MKAARSSWIGGGVIVICKDCHGQYEWTAGHRSVKWCPDCLLEHVGLCRSCRRVFDREDSAQLMCASCSPSTASARRGRQWTSTLSSAVGVQLAVLLVVAVRDRLLRRAGRW